MKTPRKITLAATVAGLLFQTVAQAFVGGINTPGTSNASITFNDTLSVPTGALYPGPSVSPWNGSIQTLPITTDPNGDFAKGSIDASYVPLTDFYWLNFGSIVLNQAAGNTGFADLIFNFAVEYQLDLLGLPSQSTIYPILIVNGTVQPGGFAQINGTINYFGSYQTTAGITTGLLDTVTYNSMWNTPGTFSGFAGGTASVGTTPALIPGTTLTLSGSMRFRVDPAMMSVESVPEPASAALLLGSAALLMVRRRRALV
jgi:hypothetical protein